MEGGFCEGVRRVGGVSWEGDEDLVTDEAVDAGTATFFGLDFCEDRT